MTDKPSVLTFRHKDGAVIKTHEGSDLAALVREEDGWTRAEEGEKAPESEESDEGEDKSEPKKAPAKKAAPKKAPPKPKGDT